MAALCFLMESSAWNVWIDNNSHSLIQLKHSSSRMNSLQLKHKFIKRGGNPTRQISPQASCKLNSLSHEPNWGRLTSSLVIMYGHSCRDPTIKLVNHSWHNTVSLLMLTVQTVLMISQMSGYILFLEYKYTNVRKNKYNKLRNKTAHNTSGPN